MILIILVILLILSSLYSIFIYLKLKKENQEIEKLRKKLNKILDDRFTILEKFINDSENFFNYEQSILKEAVQLRIQAQIDKQKGQNKKQLSSEQHITLILKQMSLLFEEYFELNTLQINYLEEFNIKEKEINEMKNNLSEKMNLYFYNKEKIPHKYICLLFEDKLSKNLYPVQYWKM